MKLRNLAKIGLVSLALMTTTGCFNQTLKKYPYAYAAFKRQPSLEEKFGSDANFAIVVVDMQDEFTPLIKKKELKKEIPNQQKVLEAAIEYDIPVLVLEYYGPSQTIPEIKEKVLEVPRYRFVTKNRDSGFLERDNCSIEGLNPVDWLNTNNVDSLYFMGINTDYCVYASAVDAFWYYDFQIATTTDVIASYSCYDNCNSVYGTFDFFAKEGYIGLNHEDFIKYLEENNN
ncbi:MAG: isochorismatase family protein [archaeon]